MSSTFKIFAIFSLASALSFAESFNGKLVDASCADQQKNSPQQQQMTSCSPSSSTTSFGVETSDGKVLKLDSTGNAKAAAAVKSSGGSKADMQATVTGSVSGTTLKVDTIDIK